MKTYSELLPHIESKDYETHLWNAMRGRRPGKEVPASNIDLSTNAHPLPSATQDKYMAALKKESLFRNLATDIHAYDTDYRIKTAQNDGASAWVPEGGTVIVSDDMSDFGEIVLGRHKLVTSFILENSFVQDNSFMIEKYLVSRLAQNFGRAEDDAFINGTGINMPTGILATEGGADVGVTTDTLTYDDVVKLFFSVKPRYRRHAVWIMNDETAYTLRSLKDADGNYIWNHANDTILGHKVYISEFMPNAESGSKPIAFGDFRYYWIVGRQPVRIRPLVEMYITIDCIGYRAYEFLDGKLVRPEAIKVIQMTA
ncbi:MAG: phage major capsid protein [Acutalibacteraceae bacterium]